MLTSKQRAALRSKASAIDSVFQIGKGDVGENQLIGLEEVLNKRELIKINVLKNSGLTPSEAAEELSKKLGAETVAVTGNKVVLYRFSKDKDVKHIEI